MAATTNEKRGFFFGLMSKSSLKELKRSDDSKDSSNTTKKTLERKDSTSRLYSAARSIRRSLKKSRNSEVEIRLNRNLPAYHSEGKGGKAKKHYFSHQDRSYSFHGKSDHKKSFKSNQENSDVIEPAVDNESVDSGARSILLTEYNLNNLNDMDEPDLLQGLPNKSVNVSQTDSESKSNHDNSTQNTCNSSSQKIESFDFEKNDPEYADNLRTSSYALLPSQTSLSILNFLESNVPYVSKSVNVDDPQNSPRSCELEEYARKYEASLIGRSRRRATPPSEDNLISSFQTTNDIISSYSDSKIKGSSYSLSEQEKNLDLNTNNDEYKSLEPMESVYTYLDPNKRLRVTDDTLKMIQKMALLDYYERYTLKKNSGMEILPTDSGNTNDKSFYRSLSQCSSKDNNTSNQHMIVRSQSQCSLYDKNHFKVMENYEFSDTERKLSQERSHDRKSAISERIFIHSSNLSRSQLEITDVKKPVTHRDHDQFVSTIMKESSTKMKSKDSLGWEKILSGKSSAVSIHSDSHKLTEDDEASQHLSLDKNSIHIHSSKSSSNHKKQFDGNEKENFSENSWNNVQPQRNIREIPCRGFHVNMNHNHSTSDSACSLSLLTGRTSTISPASTVSTISSVSSESSKASFHSLSIVSSCTIPSDEHDDPEVLSSTKLHTNGTVRKFHRNTSDEETYTHFKNDGKLLKPMIAQFDEKYCSKTKSSFIKMEVPSIEHIECDKAVLENSKVILLLKKKELLSKITKNLEILQREQESLQKKTKINDKLGEKLSASVSKLASLSECEKYNSYVEEVAKITSLLMVLSARLTKTENAISKHQSSEEKKVLIEKRDKLTEQIIEAKKLKENIDKRSEIVYKILTKYFSKEEMTNYVDFIRVRVKLISEVREISDKIKLEEEQKIALQDSL